MLSNQCFFLFCFFSSVVQCGSGARSAESVWRSQSARAGTEAGQDTDQWICHPVPCDHRGPGTWLPAWHGKTGGRLQSHIQQLDSACLPLLGLGDVLKKVITILSVNFEYFHKTYQIIFLKQVFVDLLKALCIGWIFIIKISRNTLKHLILEH